MVDEVNFTEWNASEELALSYASKAAKWVDHAWHKEKQWFVAFENGKALPEPEDKLNSTTCIVNLVMEQAEAKTKTWGISREKGWISLSEKRRMLTDSLNNLSPSKILPIKTFGVLPLFSTAYVARVLPLLLKDSNSLKRNASYAIALRRVFAELFGLLNNKSDASSGNVICHPFLLHSMRGVLSKFINLFVTDIDIKGDLENKNEERASIHGDLRELVSLMCNEQELRNVLRSALEDRSADEPLRFSYQEFDDFLKNAVASAKASLIMIEEKAVTAVLFELAKHGRANGRSVDPSTLSFSMLILAESNPGRHSALLSQGMHVLLEHARHGTFLAGMPFYSDDKGRTLFVPSIEIANATAEIALIRLDYMSKTELGELLEVTGGIQDRLIEEYIGFEVRGQNGEQKPVEGWCSDRAPSLTRIDNWITAHVMGFFISRLNLLRWAKREYVLRQYSRTPPKSDSLQWEDLPCPDKGTSCSAKKQIDEVVNQSPETRLIAPTFLLYGPPGTSKTTFAQALANSKGWDLVSLSPSDFIADSLDKIESRSRKIFQDLMNIDRCVVLMDEMDSLLRDRDEVRERNPGTMIEFVIPAFLPKLQQLRDYALRRDMAVILATNYYESLDKAIIRPGRIDNHILILPYSPDARNEVAGTLWKRIVARNNKTQGFLDALRRVPCNLVYRDVESLVRKCATCDDSNIKCTECSNLLNISGQGIWPNIYDKRNNAKSEYLSFLSRLILSMEVRQQENDESGMDMDVEAITKAIRIAKHPEWKELKEYFDRIEETV